jgi:hypothetical protein
MKICNPPLPPFSKGGMGGFGNCFLGNSKLFSFLEFEHLDLEFVSPACPAYRRRA